MNDFLDAVYGYKLDAAPWDFFLMVFWGMASTLYALAARRGRILNILVSTYMAKLLFLESGFLVSAWAGYLPEFWVSFQNLIIFSGIFLLLFFFFGHPVLRSAHEPGNFLSSLGLSLFFSALQVGLLINIVLGLMPQNFTVNFSPLAKAVFMGNAADFAWLLLPLFFVVVFYRAGRARKNPLEL